MSIVDRVYELKNKSLANETQEEKKQVELIQFGEDDIADVDWLWRDWLARGKITLMAGTPGVGKTAVALWIAAAVSRGGKMPDGSFVEKGKVLVYSTEDDINDTLLKRLHVMDADLSMIYWVKCTRSSKEGVRRFIPTEDIEALSEAMEREKFSLIIIDPIFSFMSGKTNSQEDTRAGMELLREAVVKAKPACLALTHFPKNSADRAACDKFFGSIAFIGVARIGIVVTRIMPEPIEGEKPDPALAKNVMSLVKSNTGKTDIGFEFKKTLVNQQGKYDEDNGTICIEWTSACDGDIDSDSIKPGPKPEKLENAKDFIRDALSGGPRASWKIVEEAKTIGIAQAVLYRARAALEVEAVRVDGDLCWKLPGVKVSH